MSLWNKPGKNTDSTEEVVPKVLTIPQLIKLKGAPFVLVAFFCFCALEATAGLWASSYLVNFRLIKEETAAIFAALFYLGETVGRFINGYTAEKYGDRAMIRTGIITIIIGTVLVALPFGTNIITLIGLVVIGFGAAPIYPCVIHSTPTNFGKEASQSMVGIQMASAYIGSTFVPPVFGLIAQYINIGLYPAFLMAFAVLMLVMTEKLNKKICIPAELYNDFVEK